MIVFWNPDYKVGRSVCASLLSMDYNLWFMYMLAGLYVLTPFIVRMKNVISPKMYRNLTAVLLVWAVVSQAESTYQVPYALGVVVAYLGYFMAGNWIFENTKKKPGAMIYDGVWGVIRRKWIRI